VLCSFCTSFLQNITVFFVLHRYDYVFSIKDYIKFTIFALYECFTYRFLGVIYAFFGTISYFVHTNNWNKIERTQLNL
jgi:hypothetical protein